IPYNDTQFSYDLWAVGGNGTGSRPQQTLVERLNGFLWGVEGTQNQGQFDNRLLGVAGVRGDPGHLSDAWAVGDYRAGPLGPLRTLIERYNPRSGAFSDVHSSDYFYQPVTYLARNGAISG